MNLETRPRFGENFFVKIVEVKDKALAKPVGWQRISQHFRGLKVESVFAGTQEVMVVNAALT